MSQKDEKYRVVKYSFREIITSDVVMGVFVYVFSMIPVSNFIVPRWMSPCEEKEYGFPFTFYTDYICGEERHVGCGCGSDFNPTLLIVDIWYILLYIVLSVFMSRLFRGKLWLLKWILIFFVWIIFAAILTGSLNNIFSSSCFLFPGETPSAWYDEVCK